MNEPITEIVQRIRNWRESLNIQKSTKPRENDEEKAQIVRDQES